MSNRPILILTNCTHRKRGAISNELLARSLPKATYSAVSAEWAKRIKTAPRLSKAEELYCGRAVTETLHSARALSADVAFLSAGLGVVTREERVPAYNLTASSGGPDSIDERLTEPYSPAVWWRSLLHALRRRGVLARLIEERRPALILAALPASYLHLVREELESLPRSAKQTLRILGPRRSGDVPEGLRSQWLPYDDRLDNPESGVNGTTADFPQRALRHFAAHLSKGRVEQSVERHQRLVEQSLCALAPYVRTRGATATDEEVLGVIKGLWEKCAGNRARVLRELRAHSGLACEQSRFRRLADRFEGKR